MSAFVDLLNEAQAIGMYNIAFDVQLERRAHNGGEGALDTWCVKYLEASGDPALMARGRTVEEALGRLIAGMKALRGLP